MFMNFIGFQKVRYFTATLIALISSVVFLDNANASIQCSEVFSVNSAYTKLLRSHDRQVDVKIRSIPANADLKMAMQVNPFIPDFLLKKNV